MDFHSIGHTKLKRATKILVGVLLLFAVLLGRIFIIQSVDYDRYLQKVIDQMTTQSAVRAERGKILDRWGNVLATSITTYRVFISPSSIRNAQKNADKSGISVDFARDIALGLSQILSLDYDKVLKQTTYYRYLDRTIAKNVGDSDADRIRELINEGGYHEMVYLEASSTRYYPCGTLASSVLGFTNADGDGVYGLESYYNEMLRGEDGYYVTARDSFGNEMPFEYASYIAAKSGANLETTIDIFIQNALEEQLMASVAESGAKNRACGVVVNVKTGAILAMATVPGFDPNTPWELNDYYSEFLAEDGYVEGSGEYEAAYNDYLLDMWRNKAVSDSYIPGSTFKILTSSMALTEGCVKLSGDSVFCGGSLLRSGHTIHCHKVKGHGSLSFPEGLVQSCNVWFMTLGERLGISKFYNYFKSFGYLERTGIDLPAEGGSIIKTQSSMTELDLAIYAFGQNFNITPIQHIMAVAAVANGGYLLEPYLVQRVVDSDGRALYEHGTVARRQVISSEVCREIASILESGVSGEGGAKNAYVAGYKVAAKTGTSEKKGSEIRVDNVKAYVCSCVAFAPADDPEIAVLIMVDEPSRGILYGSVIAAPYIGGFLGAVLPYIGEERDESALTSVQVPDLVGKSTQDALLAAQGYGYEVILKGEGNYVTSQIPRASQNIDKTNKIITLYTGNSPEEKSCTVPDLVGKGAYEANILLTNAQLNIKIEGATSGFSGSGATVITQSIAKGAQVPPGTVVTVTLRYLDPD